MKHSLKLFLIAALATGFTTAPFVNAKVPEDKLEEVKKLKKSRGGKALGPRIGKKVQNAFELYLEDNVEGALEILLDLNPSNKFDQAYVGRFIGNMYAGLEGKATEALKYLKEAEALDQLPFDDHAGVLKLVADLSLQEKEYEQALVYYQKYMDFSFDQDANVYLRMANSYYELKQYDNVLAPAKKSIELFEKPNQNPYVLIMASYYERKMYPEAVKAVETLVKVFPENPKWWTQLGMFYMLTEDYERGLSTMEVAYKQGYLETQSQVKQLAQLYATNGIPYKAAMIQEKFITSGLIDKTEQALSIMASTFQNAKEFGKAAKYFGEAAKLSSDADLYRRQANVLMVLEDYKAAVTAFNKSLDAGIKRKGQVYMGLAEAHFYLENWKDAYAAILEAKKDNSTKNSARGWESYIKDTAQRKGTVF
jgi:tetratricopeptide (TPR) repeat protein